MRADFHVHTPLCKHATGEPEEYVAAAVAAGLGEIGFADHNPQPLEFDDWRMGLEDLPGYVEAVRRAGEKAGIPVRLGLECDFFEGNEGWIEKLAGMADWDFLVGSVHYIAEGWDVDNPKHVQRLAGDVDRAWDLYWAAYERCVRSRMFDFVAHPDLPKKFGHRPGGDLRRYYGPVVEALAVAGGAFEINTAGLRKDVGEAYPDRLFLEMAREAQVPVLINSDAHAPEEVGAGFAEAEALARDAGYEETVRFVKRHRVFGPLG